MGILHQTQSRWISRDIQNQTCGKGIYPDLWYWLPRNILNTVRVLLSLAVNLDWPLHQFNVKNAFLHWNLEEEVYMDIPPGFKMSVKDKCMCRLQKALYGLKQSSRAWFRRFSSSMRKKGFRQSDSDHTLFLKNQNGRIIALIIYVNDMIIIRNDDKEIIDL